PRASLYPRKCVYESVRSIEDFEPWIARIEEEIDERVLIEAIAQIPQEWYDGNSAALRSLVEQLDQRRRQVRDKILRLTGPWRDDFFPNWRVRGIPPRQIRFSC